MNCTKRAPKHAEKYQCIKLDGHEGTCFFVHNCDLAPKGWQCTRLRAHTGPCAAIPVRGVFGQFMDALGTAIGEAMFGGNR
jgi:hypothetical protein